MILFASLTFATGLVLVYVIAHLDAVRALLPRWN